MGSWTLCGRSWILIDTVSRGIEDTHRRVSQSVGMRPRRGIRAVTLTNQVGRTLRASTASIGRRRCRRQALSAIPLQQLQAIGEDRDHTRQQRVSLMAPVASLTILRTRNNIVSPSALDNDDGWSRRGQKDRLAAEEVPLKAYSGSLRQPGNRSTGSLAGLGWEWEWKGYVEARLNDLLWMRQEGKMTETNGHG